MCCCASSTRTLRRKGSWWQRSVSRSLNWRNGCWSSTLSICSSVRLRALDAIQIAVALRLRNQGLVDQFVSADKVLCEVAALEGFAVFDPEHS